MDISPQDFALSGRHTPARRRVDGPSGRRADALARGFGVTRLHQIPCVGQHGNFDHPLLKRSWRLIGEAPFELQNHLQIVPAQNLIEDHDLSALGDTWLLANKEPADEGVRSHLSVRPDDLRGILARSAKAGDHKVELRPGWW